MNAAAYIPRTLETTLRRALAQFPAVMLTGPRQAGKTTLLRRALDETHGYVSLDAMDVREAARTDPRGFLAAHPPPVILDEVQHAPALLTYVKERIDGERDRRGLWVLTGSQNLLLAKGVTETLAGRVALLRLLPLSLREMTGDPTDRSRGRPGGRGSQRRRPPRRRRRGRGSSAAATRSSSRSRTSIRICGTRATSARIWNATCAT